MQERNVVAHRAAQEIENWLKKNPKTLAVINVENLIQYQAIDIDIIWKTINREIKIEIKGDTYSGDKNFFLETFSNKEKNTAGCFLYTQADYVFYYFVKPKKLFIFGMPQTREWFLEHIHKFREVETQTAIGNNQYYTTVGRLVPVKTLMSNVKSTKFYQL